MSGWVGVCEWVGVHVSGGVGRSGCVSVDNTTLWGSVLY